MIGRTLSHYRVDAQLGMGGMGIVYRAYDVKLQRPVAIKLLGDSSDQAARRHLLEEARAASALNHPNIATIHEVDDAGERAFIVMEYIEGKSLSELIAGEDLSIDTAMEYGSQIAEALEHAHDHGIVHRDLKSANVVVTPEGRVKVLDFGLARRMGSNDLESVTRSHTAAEGLAGTLAYMAPEVLKGDRADIRSDIWALGVTLYELATRALPFTGRTGFDLTGAILHEAPRLLPRHVPPVLRAIVQRCLAKEPARRYQRASEVRAALEAARLAPQRRLAAPLRVTLLAVIAVLVGAWGAYRLLGPSERPAPRGEASAASTLTVRPSVAVLGFRNLSGRADAAWLSTACAEMLTTELAAGGKLRAIPGENVARMKIDLALSDADSYASDTLARIRQRLGSDLVVLGSYVTVGETPGRRIRLDLRLQDAAAGETILSITESGTEEDLFDLISRAGVGLRDRLGVAARSPTDTTAVRASLPANTEAARLYAEGLSRLRQFDALAARDLLQRATTADPQHALTRSALAAAWSALGYDGKARTEARAARELSSSLSREDRLSVESIDHEMMREWDQAIKIYRSLFTFFPDSLDYGLRLAAAQSSSGDAKGAIATVATLRRLPPPAADDPRIDLAEATAADRLSDFTSARTTAAAAASKGQRQGDRLLVASARLLEGGALFRLGDPNGAKRVYEDARQIYLTAGDRGGVARVLNSLGSVLLDQGDMRAGLQMYRESLAIAREIGYQTAVARALNNIAIQLRRAGDLDGALAMHREALAIRREIDEKTTMAVSLNNIGNVLLDRGDLAGARQMYEEAQAVHREIGDRHGLARALHNAAVVLKLQGQLAAARKTNEEALALRQQIGDKLAIAMSMHNMAEGLQLEGDLTGARKLFSEAITRHRELGDKHGTAYGLFGMGEVAFAQGDVAGARKAHEEALAIRNQIGQKGTAAESQVGLAQVLLEEGAPERAEALARQAVAELRTQKAAETEAYGCAVLGRALIALGRTEAASREIDRALALLRQSENRTVRLPVAVSAARVWAASGESTRARKILQETVTEAGRLGLVGIHLDARLALGELELRAGDAQAGRARLAALEIDAAAKGFHLVARRAAALRQPRGLQDVRPDVGPRMRE